MSCESESSITYAEGVVGLGDCTNDVYVLEKGHPDRGSELSRGPNQPLHSSNGDPRFAGRHYHHHRPDVWNWDARIFTETPTSFKIERRENKRLNTGGVKGKWHEKKYSKNIVLDLMGLAMFKIFVLYLSVHCFSADFTPLPF